MARNTACCACPANDQAGSAGYIALALVTSRDPDVDQPAAPADVVVGIVLGVSGLAFGSAGLPDGWGLTVTMARGEEVPEQMWRSLLLSKS